MTPKEKARDLYEKYYYHTQSPIGSINYSIITINEVIKELEQLAKPEYTTFISNHLESETMDGYEKRDFWDQVKTEIENL
jgi:hypothetical protein